MRVWLDEVAIHKDTYKNLIDQVDELKKLKEKIQEEMNYGRGNIILLTLDNHEVIKQVDLCELRTKKSIRFLVQEDFNIFAASYEDQNFTEAAYREYFFNGNWKMLNGKSVKVFEER